jgi:phosphate transport system substrate-binding protein
MNRAFVLLGRAALALALAAGLHAAEGAATPVRPGYVLASGALQIVGRPDFAPFFERLNSLYAEAHPGTGFRYAPGDDLAALHSLVYDASLFAPVGTEFLAGMLGPQHIVVHADPFGIRIAHASLQRDASLSPLAIVVHPANPLANLSTGQVARIFTTGMRQSGLTWWRQLGVTGALHDGEIHAYALPESDHYPSEDGGFAEYLFVRKFDGAPATLNYQRVPTYSGVVEKVAADPQAIGITMLNRVTDQVKVLGIRSGEWAAPSKGTAADLVAGKYAYDRYVWVYVRRPPNQPLDPIAKAYLRLALSPAGQRVIASDSHGYLPLNETEIGEELAKLE